MKFILILITLKLTKLILTILIFYKIIIIIEAYYIYNYTKNNCYILTLDDKKIDNSFYSFKIIFITHHKSVFNLLLNKINHGEYLLRGNYFSIFYFYIEKINNNYYLFILLNYINNYINLYKYIRIILFILLFIIDILNSYIFLLYNKIYLCKINENFFYIFYQNKDIRSLYLARKYYELMEYILYYKYNGCYKSVIYRKNRIWYTNNFSLFCFLKNYK